MPDDPKTSVAMPLTITDVIKGLREALGLVDDIAVKVKAVAEAVRSAKGGKVAKSLDALSFRGDGSRKHLERIAAGTAHQSDFDAIAAKMDETSAIVEASIDRIQEYRDFIRKRHGLAVANKIDDLIYAGGGKASIRVDLMYLAGMDSSGFTPEQAAGEAQKILNDILNLNTKIEEFHDLILELEKQEK